MDHSQPLKAFPVVVICGGAHCVERVERFFSSLKIDAAPCMAFLLLDQPTLLSFVEWLAKVQSWTHLKVETLQHGQELVRDTVYLVPADHTVTFDDGCLGLRERSVDEQLQESSDGVLRSLANDRQRFAIAVVLSDAAVTDLGILAIKSESGLVMLEFVEPGLVDHRQRSVINEELADYALPVEQLAVTLLAYAKQAFDDDRMEVIAATVSEENVARRNRLLQKVLQQLRSHVGHDFSSYKTSTILRRIERRMAVHHIASEREYLRYLQQSPPEAEALFRDLLIGVTTFFRDQAVFSKLQSEIIPEIFQERKSKDLNVRVWICGCSTGEEAYSIAMLLHEEMEKHQERFTVQMFATDVDPRAIAAARVGIYARSVVADVSPARLNRYFTQEASGNAYRINKVIREMLVFSEHDLVTDPPFSRMDLISCRNVMIYFNSTSQKSVLKTFHFALNLKGVLLLGLSEGVGFSKGFDAVDRNLKIYQRNVTVRSVPEALTHGIIEVFPQESASVVNRLRSSDLSHSPLKELTESALLRELSPVGALVNNRGDLLYVYGRAGMYLEVGSGAVEINNIHKMARDTIRHEVTAALNKAVSTHQSVRVPGLLVESGGHFVRINVSVSPVVVGKDETANAHLFLVLFTELPEAIQTYFPNNELVDLETRLTTDSTSQSRNEGAREFKTLLTEIKRRDEYLQTTREELESSNEELRASNGELQSINEELQASVEELETSKEEAQSVNEELKTVNAELKFKFDELTKSNDDMRNLIAATNNGTLFIDQYSRIMRYTEAACDVINLIPSDVGRPIAHTVTNFVNYDNLASDIESVNDRLIPIIRTLETKSGRWYQMSIQPYRTQENVIEGAVIDFVDITSFKEVQKQLEKERVTLAFQATLLRSIGEAVIATDPQGIITYWNSAAEQVFGWRTDEVLGKNIVDVTPAAGGREHGHEILESLKLGNRWSGEISVRHRNGHEFVLKATNTSVCDSAGNLTGIIGVSTDITVHKNQENLLEELREISRLAFVFRDSPEAVSVHNLDGLIIAWNPAAEKLYGWTEAEAMRMNVRERFSIEAQSGLLERLFDLACTEGWKPQESRRRCKQGYSLDVWVSLSTLVNQSGTVYAIVSTERPAVPNS